MKKLRLLAGFTITCLSAFAQQQSEWCGTTQHFNRLAQEHPEWLQQWEEQLEIIRQKQAEFEYQYYQNPLTNETVKIIPVVVHIVHDNWLGDISDAQVEDGIAVLNEDFRRLNADTSQTRAIFKPYAADCEYEFRLAKIDPNGNCTKGIVRVNSPLTNNATDAVKSTSYWPSNKYFNVWLVRSIDNGGNTGTILGYAQFPGMGSWSTYGVVIRHDQWGRIGTSVSDGRTASHEVGHCLGLFHTFQDGCGSNCSNSGDQVCDTPPTANATYGCNTSQNTCSNDAGGSSPYTSNVPDQIENYMSYDNCQNMFTLGQKARMNATVAAFSQLQQLTSASNLIATGTNDGYTPSLCAPKADFAWDKRFICAGGSVSYTDKSWNGAPTSWNWTFQGGTPSSSTQQNPTVTYNTPGVYATTLTATNSAGSNTKTVNNLIYVSSISAQHSQWPLMEDFENASQFNNEWIILNGSGNGWTLTNTTAYSGNQCMRLVNSGQPAGSIDEAITPSYNLTVVGSGAKLRFKVAFAQKSSANNDNLRVFYSTNCGQTWSIKYSKAGSNLATVPPTTSPFTPSSQSQWREEIIDLSGLTNQTNIRFKFWFNSDGGNNIYIDDINIDKANDITETTEPNYQFNAYPNPTHETLKVQFYLEKEEKISLILYDITGREIVRLLHNIPLAQGLHTIDMDYLPQHTSKGIYLLMLTSENASLTRKIVIN